MEIQRGRMRCVVAATDFSPGSAGAVARAVLLPLARDATLSIVHVLSDSTPPRLAAVARDRATAALRDLVEETRRAAGRAGTAVTVEGALLTGRPYVEVVRHARARGADLVVVGRHRPRAVRDAFVGSTAERVIRKSDVPVLVVNEAAGGPYRRALVPLDLSDVPRRVVELALALLPDDVREIELVHAYHVAFEDWFGETALRAEREERAERARHVAKDVAAALEPLGIACELEVREGDPRIAVLRHALRQRSDVIVLATHSREGLAHALLGSVAEWLIRSAPCDVAVTRPARFTFELP